MRALLLVLLSFIFIILDQQSAYFQNWRQKISVIALPVQYLVDTPLHWLDWAGSTITAQRDLLVENAKLRAHELLLESKLQKLLEVERENAQLHELLSSTPHLGGKVLVAQLLAIDLNPALQQLIVDKGAKQEVYVGQPAMDAYGVVGQVVHTGYLTSKIMLITDTRSAIPVRDDRNGVRSVVAGQGVGGLLSLLNVPDTTDIQVGDVFSTSGLDLHFPIGYPVAKVVDVRHQPGLRFAQVLLQPFAHLDRSEQVVLVWPDRVKLDQEVQEQLQQPVFTPAIGAGGAPSKSSSTPGSVTSTTSASASVSVITGTGERGVKRRGISNA